MNAVACANVGCQTYTSSLRTYFSEQVTKIAELLSRDVELKDGLLSIGDDLANTVNVACDNSIPLSDEAVAKLRGTLQWMEEYLDGKNKKFMLSGEQENRLRHIYNDIAEALSVVVIQSSLNLRIG